MSEARRESASAAPQADLEEVKVQTEAQIETLKNRIETLQRSASAAASSSTTRPEDFAIAEETDDEDMEEEEKAIAKLEAAGALHWSGPDKPWNIPRKVHPYMSRAWEYEAKLVNIAPPPDVPPRPASAPRAP